MIRNIINIKEVLCNGCGLCVNACHEGAIEMIDGKARLISDEYCDGLGDCLPECPTGAISIVKRESKEFDEEKVKERMEKKNTKKEVHACECPGSKTRMISKKSREVKETQEVDIGSELMTWPVQLSLVSPRAAYFDGADVLIAADCTAYAYGNFHNDFIKDKVTIIGCPKLDDVGYYEEKLTEIFSNNNIESVTVVRMSVPCCGGIVYAVRNALLKAKKILPYSEVVVDTDGEILKK